MANSGLWKAKKSLLVVNCFQISNFVLWQTAADLNKRLNEML